MVSPYEVLISGFLLGMRVVGQSERFFIKIVEADYSWEAMKDNCHVLNCDLQFISFCWFILILILQKQTLKKGYSLVFSPLVSTGIVYKVTNSCFSC